MRAEPLTEDSYSEWDDLAARSPDAWFWHTTAWMHYSREYAGPAFRQNLSFWVVQDRSKLALVPCFLEFGPPTTSLYHDQQRGADQPRLAYAGVPLPAPALAPGLGAEKRWEVFQFAVAQLKQLASSSAVRAFQLIVPALAPRYLTSALPQANPLQRVDALELPRATQIVDLRRDLAELWSDVRHGHQYDIRRGERVLAVEIWRGGELPDNRFQDYRRIHAEDAGRITRSDATFLMMREWIRNNRGALIMVHRDGQPLGFVLLILFGKGAFYASACRRPQEMKLPIFHLAQWALIRWLKEQGFSFYDLGLQQFGQQWFDSPHAKHLGISKFKRGFGGTAVPLYMGELHLDREGLRRSIEVRLEQNLPREVAATVAL
ncbi:MAG: GNAT family N-acetyltransferase [Hyphomicrobiales bacterium]|nr:GNAT family N-acetyltransferase [Hyphomicrobiales bacterium]